MIVTATAGASLLARATGHQVTATSFVNLFRQYRTGDADAAVRMFQTWPASRIEREARLPLGQDDGWSQAALALLHLETHWSQGSLPGWFGNADAASKLIDEAQRVARLTGDTQLQTFCRDWYRVALTSLGGAITGNPDTLIRAARKLMPEDPGIQLALGTYFEYWMQLVPTDGWGYGKAAEATAGDGFVRVAPANLSTSHGQFYRAGAAEAEASFRRALTRDPHLVEAHVRLGRVLWLLDHRDDAERELRQAQQDGWRDPDMGYLAALFLGRLFEETRRFDAAHRAYEDALRFVPLGQSARLALAHMLLTTGREGEAWSAAAESLGLVGAEAPVLDPWTLYPEGRVCWERIARIRALRTQVRKQ